EPLYAGLHHLYRPSLHRLPTGVPGPGSVKVEPGTKIAFRGSCSDDSQGAHRLRWKKDSHAFAHSHLPPDCASRQFQPHQSQRTRVAAVSLLAEILSQTLRKTPLRRDAQPSA